MDCLPGPSSRPVEMKDGSRIGDSVVDGGEAEAGAARRRLERRVGHQGVW